MASTNGQDNVPSMMSRLIERRTPGRGLEAAFYTSSDIFDFDMEAIFARHWIHVGVEADVPAAGDFVTIDLGRYSIILVRGHDLQVRAFHNVCRHRGARILNENKGSAATLTCMYHRWTYDLTGPLRFAEHLAPDLDRSCLGLKPVNLRSLCGLLFICLAETPPDDFDEMQRQVEPFLAPHDLRNCKIAKQIDVVLNGNWKVAMENNRECYHCGGHRELLRIFFQFFAHSESDVKPRQRAYYERYRRIHAEMVQIWESLKLPWALVEHLDDCATAFRVERMALDNAGESYTTDTTVASKRLVGGFATPRLGALSVHTQPNSWNHFLSDHAVVFDILPLSPEKTLLRTKWLVHKDAEEGKDYDLENLTEVWRKTNEQDATFVGWNQAGISNPAYEPGHYSPNENQVEKFVSWYVERVASYLGLRRLPLPASAKSDQMSDTLPH